MQPKMMQDIDIKDLHNKEVEAMDLFRVQFNNSNPVPVKPSSWSIKDLGIEFPVIFVTGIAAVIQAGLRTGAKFFSLAEANSWNSTLAIADGLSATIGVEGMVFAAGFLKARASHKNTDASNITFDNNSTLWVVIIGLAISIIAGMAQSLTDNTSIPPGVISAIDWAILFILGAGASVLAYFAGEMVGLVMVRAEKIWRQKFTAYETLVVERDGKFREEWARSDLYKFLHVDIRGVSRLQASSYTSGLPAAPRVRQFENNGSVRAEIYKYMDTHATKTNKPGPTDLANALGVAKSYASIVIREWAIERNYPEYLTSETDDSTGQ